MTIIVELLALAELLFFFIYDFRTSKGNRSERYALRLMSCVSGITLILLDLVLPCHTGMSEVAVDLSSATAILVMYPCSFEKPRTSFLAAKCLMVYMIAVSVFFGLRSAGSLGFKFQRAVSSFAPLFIFVLCFYLYIAYRRFAGIRSIFRNTAVWHNVEEHSRFLYTMAFLVAGMLLMCGLHMPGHMGDLLSVITLILYLSLYAVLFLRAMTGRTFVLSKETENRIKDIIKGNLRTSCVEKADEDNKMNNLYRRVVMYMEETKPYLDHTFDMSSLADRMLTNKLYLSKTINILSGRNFRQFVNYYRVQRAIELFKKDPRLKVCEVSEMSGFHTAVSFNMSFKMNTGKTPSEWLQDQVTASERVQ